jgi:hypothetical protein
MLQIITLYTAMCTGAAWGRPHGTVAVIGAIATIG